MRFQILFDDQASAIEAAGHQVDPDADVVVVSTDPWIAVTSDAWEIIREAVRRVWGQKHSERIKASGRAGRPREYDLDVIRLAIASYGSEAAAAKALGIGRNTIRRYLGKDRR